MKVLSREDARAFVQRLHEDGKRVVFTNGVFDILHPGHVRYLTAAREQGDALIVAINADPSVRAIKGPERPINADYERAEVLSALACVDAVVVFEDANPRSLVVELEPDVLVKGSDWELDAIIGREEVEARGGRVARIPFEGGYSTSEIIRKIRWRPQPP